MTSENLDSYLSGRWVRGRGIETRLVDPVRGDELATVSANGVDLEGALAYARREGQGLRKLSYGERAKLIGAVADVLVANRARYEEIAIVNSGNTKPDAADRYRWCHRHPQIFRAARCRTRRWPYAARRETGTPRQGGELSGHSSDGAEAGRRHSHQRVQFPELGSVGEGRGGAALRHAGTRQAGIGDRAARACDGARRGRRQGAAGWRAQPPVRGRR